MYDSYNRFPSRPTGTHTRVRVDARPRLGGQSEQQWECEHRGTESSSRTKPTACDVRECSHVLSSALATSYLTSAAAGFAGPRLATRRRGATAAFLKFDDERANFLTAVILRRHRLRRQPDRFAGFK